MIINPKRADYPYCLHSSFYYNTTCRRQQAEVFFSPLHDKKTACSKQKEQAVHLSVCQHNQGNIYTHDQHKQYHASAGKEAADTLAVHPF